MHREKQKWEILVSGKSEYCEIVADTIYETISTTTDDLIDRFMIDSAKVKSARLTFVKFNMCTCSSINGYYYYKLPLINRLYCMWKLILDIINYPCMPTFSVMQSLHVRDMILIIIVLIIRSYKIIFGDMLKSQGNHNNCHYS